MKKRKILYLIPFAALVLSGCTFQEGWQTTTGWLNKNVWTPVVEFFEGLFGKKDEKKDEEEDGPKPTPTPTPGEETVVGSLEQPLSLADFKAYVENVVPAPGDGKTNRDDEHVYYLKGKVVSQNKDANENRQISFVNLEEDDVKVTLYYCTLDESVDDKYLVANSMLGADVIVKGYAARYKKDADSAETLEVTYKKVDDTTYPAYILDVDKPTSGENYGTLESPLTIAEARALLDRESPALETMYVRGKIKSNGGYVEKYKNAIVWITDGENDFELYGCTFPNNEQTAAGQYVDQYCVAHGSGKIFTQTSGSKVYEFDSGCVIDLVEPKEAVKVTSISFGQIDNPIEMEIGKASAQVQLTATVLPENADDRTVTWTSQDEEVVTVADGLITAVAAGSTTVTATANDGSGVSAVANVHVTQPETPVTLESISVEEKVEEPAKRNYAVGEPFSSEGLSVTAHYSDGSSAAVTTGLTWSFEIDNVEVTTAAIDHDGATLKVIAHYEEQEVEYTGEFNVVGISVQQVSSIKAVYDVFDAFEGTADITSTETVSFSGVVTGVTGKSFWVQDLDYAVYVYNKSGHGATVGKIVDVTGKVARYKGLCQIAGNDAATTVTVGEDGDLPSTALISNATDLENTRQNMFVRVENAEVVSLGTAWSSNSNGILNITLGGSAMTVKFDKYSFDATKGAEINALNPTDTISLDDIFVSVYNSKQLVFIGSSTATIVKAEIAPETVTVIGGTTVQTSGTLQLSAEVGPQGAPQDVVWSIESEDKLGCTISDGVLTAGTQTGDVVVRATAASDETVYGEKTITISSSVTPKEETKVTKSSSELATEHGWTASAGTTIGTKFTTFALDENITVNFVGIGNTATYWSSGTNIRIYGTKNSSDASVSFVGGSGVTILSVKLTFTLSNATFPLTSGTAEAVNDSSATYALTSGTSNGQLRITDFEVVYEK